VTRAPIRTLAAASGTLATVAALCLVAPGVTASPRAGDGNLASALVLSQRDVGSSYVLNRPFTRARTLREVSTNASAAAKAQLARLWVAGMQDAFNGGPAVSGQSLLSTADVFRSTELTTIVRSWQGTYLRLSHGVRLTLPQGAPGSGRILIRGRLQADEVLLYLWQRGKAVLTTWIVGKPGLPTTTQLMALARQQDSRVPASLR
jgi:hypothetical protein